MIKNKQKGSINIIIAVIAVAVVAFGGAYFFFGSSSPAEQVATTSDWKTFPTVDYVISYPPGFEISNNGELRIAFPQNYFDGPKTNYSGAFLRINSTDPVEDCYGGYYAGEEVEAGEIVTINGTEFRKMQNSDAGAGQYYDSEVYSAIRGGVCFKIFLTVHTGNIGAYDPPVAEFDKEKALVVLRKILSTFQFAATAPVETGFDKPAIESITPESGPVGTVIELRGKNFNGFEGDLDAWIENSMGKRGIVHAANRYTTPETATLIRFKLEEKICTINTSYSGLDCPEYLDIIPGVYKVYAEPWGNRSNIVQFTVTAN